MPLPTLRPARATALAFAASALVLAGCGGGWSSSASGRVRVVAAENFWGSIAAQLGGDRVVVSSIIVNPDTDPHSYDPTAQDARTFAGARLAIVNGIGYDNWATHLLDADSVASANIVSVGSVLGLVDGDNPHQWYSPASVNRVIHAITTELERLDPADRLYFVQRERSLQTRWLAAYHALINEIARRFAGVPVGYSESIFQPLGAALHLRLLTPYSFAKAIAEGTDVSAADKEAVDSQATNREIRVWVFNSQNVTPDVQRVNVLARDAGIPIATVTETLSPAGDSFEQWQVTELRGLLGALHLATGR